MLRTKGQVSEPSASEEKDSLKLSYGSDKKIRIVFVLCFFFYASSPGPPGVRPFWILGPTFKQTL